MGVIKRGAIWGIIILICAVINIILAFSLRTSEFILFRFVTDFFLSAVIYAGSIFYLLAFIALAKKTNIKLLKVVSYIFLVLTIIVIVISVPLGIYRVYIAATNPDLLAARLSPDLNSTDGSLNTTISPEIAGTILGSLVVLMFGLLFLVILIILGFFTLIVLEGVALIKLGKEFPLAKTTGILEIVTIGLALTIIGIIFAIPLSVAVGVMKIVLLFQAAEKYEGGKYEGGQDIKKKGDLRERVKRRAGERLEV